MKDLEQFVNGNDQESNEFLEKMKRILSDDVAFVYDVKSGMSTLFVQQSAIPQMNQLLQKYGYEPVGQPHQNSNVGLYTAMNSPVIRSKFDNPEFFEQHEFGSLAEMWSVDELRPDGGMFGGALLSQILEQDDRIVPILGVQMF